MDHRRLEFAVIVFLSEMRRQFIRLNPSGTPPSLSLMDYDPKHRSALMQAVSKAVTASEPKSDQIFANWSASRDKDLEV